MEKSSRKTKKTAWLVLVNKLDKWGINTKIVDMSEVESIR